MFYFRKLSYDKGRGQLKKHYKDQETVVFIFLFVFKMDLKRMIFSKTLVINFRKAILYYKFILGYCTEVQSDLVFSRKI